MDIKVRWMRRPSEADVADVLMLIAALVVAGMWAAVLVR